MSKFHPKNPTHHQKSISRPTKNKKKNFSTTFSKVNFKIPPEETNLPSKIYILKKPGPTKNKKEKR
jgi:hypothetical protein